MQKIQAENVTNDNTNKTRKSKPVRSFVRRARKLPPKKQQIVEQVGQQYLLTASKNKVDFAKVFDRDASLIIEIGFGMGEGLLYLAQAIPDKNFLGIEVHKPGVAAVLTYLQQNPLNNVRIYEHDAVEIFNDCIADNSVERIMLYFPDPWPKRRHHKRRLIQKDFAELIATKLRIGGILQISTDCDDYAKHCIKTLSMVRKFANNAEIPNPSKSIPTQPFQHIVTRFKQRGIKLGHKISDLIYIRQQA